MIWDALASALMLAGAAFMLLAGVAVVRMPDLYMRMSATTKAGTLGIGLILLGMIVYFGDLGVTVRALAVIFFGFLTAPVAAHMISRAAYIVGVPLWEGTIVDELRGHYDLRTHVLSSVTPGREREAEAERP
jgi:multicomponent Na+:H+ antiporter subunit G